MARAAVRRPGQGLIRLPGTPTGDHGRRMTTDPRTLNRGGPEGLTAGGTVTGQSGGVTQPAMKTTMASQQTVGRPGNGLIPRTDATRAAVRGDRGTTDVRPGQGGGPDALQGRTMLKAQGGAPQVGGGTMQQQQQQQGGTPQSVNYARQDAMAPGTDEIVNPLDTPMESVSDRLGALLDEDSPYLDRARVRAREQANARGLMSSSIAAGAAEGAAIDRAGAIATADAEMAARERELRSAQFMQSKDHRVQELMQQRGFDHASAENLADREHRELLQTRDHRVQQLMQQTGLDHTSAENQANRELEETLQSRSIESAESMQERSIESQEGMQERELYIRQVMQDKGLDHESAERSLDRDLSEFLQERQLEVQQVMQERGFSHEAAQNSLDRKLQSDLASAERNLREVMQQRDHRVQQIMQTERITHAAAEGRANRQMQGQIANAQIRAASARQASQLAAMAQQSSLDRAHSAEQGELNREADAARAYQTGHQNVMNTYQNSLNMITLNTDLPEEVRNAAIDEATRIRDAGVEALNEIHGRE